MIDKTLKNKAIKFKGKDYVLVSDRVKYFNDNYHGSIYTKLISKPDSDMVIVKAFVRYQDEQANRHMFTGMSQAKWSDTQSFVNKTSALENAETSAVGRALAFMGIGVIDSIASADEVKKTTYTSPSPIKQTKTDEVVREPILKSDGDCEVCGATLEFKTGTTKDGKKYQGFFCPNSKVGEKHTVTDFKYI